MPLLFNFRPQYRNGRAIRLSIIESNLLYLIPKADSCVILHLHSQKKVVQSILFTLTLWRSNE